MITVGNSYDTRMIDCNISFPDGTPLVQSFINKIDDSDIDDLKIIWKYEGESELFRLYCIVRDLQEKGASNITLFITYLPNARMDRVHDSDDVFTLKYFAEYINSMNFKKVYVLDAHSDVSLALINRCENIQPVFFIENILKRLNFDPEKDFIVYPDAGCKKRLEDKLKFPSVFGNKSRDWKTGKILGVDIYGEDLTKLNGARVLFVDDICAYGGTAKYTLTELLKYGVTECYCYFTHVEKSIFGKEGWEETGEGVPTLLNSNVVDGIYITDSLISEDYVCAKKKDFDVPFSGFRVVDFMNNYI